MIARIDELGGAVAAIEAGWVQGEIEAAAYRWTESVESGERVIVGVNSNVEEGREEIGLHRLDPESERRQIERTASVRAGRNVAEAEVALARAGAHEDKEPAAADPRRAGAMCTVGEVCRRSAKSGGTYDR